MDYPHFLRKWLADAQSCLLTDGDRTVARVPTARVPIARVPLARGALASDVARVALEHDAADGVLGTEQFG